MTRQRLMGAPSELDRMNCSGRSIIRLRAPGHSLTRGILLNVGVGVYCLHPPVCGLC